MATVGEQSQTENSQEVQTPQQHEKAMEERIMSLLDPEPKATDTKPDAKPEAETPTEETPEASPEGEQAEAVAEEKPDEKEPEIPEAVDVEYEGKSYKLPPQIKDALLRQSDYTKKTQEVAESKKTADTLLQQAKELFELQKGQQKHLGQLAAVEEQIAQYEKVDWNTLTASDATRAQQLFIAFQQAKDSKGKIEKELQQAHSQMMEAAQKGRAAKVEEGQKALTRDIKGWSADLGRKIMGFAEQAYGFSQEELGNVIDPRTVKALHDAYQFRQLQAAKPAVKQAVPAAKTLKPQAAETRTPAQQSYDADKRALRSAKNSTEMSRAAERIILRKLG
jgi:hypothetical protein